MLDVLFCVTFIFDVMIFMLSCSLWSFKLLSLECCRKQLRPDHMKLNLYRQAALCIFSNRFRVSRSTICLGTERVVKI